MHTHTRAANAPALFITGTDTGVGKTLVTAGILRYFRARGIDAVSMKPVQTGGNPAMGPAAAPDLYVHQRAAGYSIRPEEACLAAPYVYTPAYSPHLAARMAGRPVEIAVIIEALGALRSRHGLVLVEGAGGILVPLNETETQLDLMAALDLPVVLVGRLGLGGINHALLSLAVLRGAGLRVLGVVLNETEVVVDLMIREDNPRAIADFGRVPVLAVIPHLGTVVPADPQTWTRFGAEAAGLFRAVECMLQDMPQ